MSQKFKSDIEVQAGLRDSSGSLGTSGQVLSTTGTGVAWINESQVAHTISNQVKAGVAINKGQAVYATGADGTNIIVGLASNAAEATSSKTLGLLDATVSANGFANVVENGKLDGLNTLGAVAGDPVWLGVNGNLIYGLANKPYAPANLVFIGIVTRVNANNGEIFVNVQNGFELNEIHDVDLKTTVPVNGDVLGFNGTLWVNKTIAQWLGYTPANANGTTNYVSKFTGATTLGNSQIFDNGTNVGIGTTSPSSILHLNSAVPFLSIQGSTSGSLRGINIMQGSTVFSSLSAEASLGETRLSAGFSGWGGFQTFYTNGSEKMRILAGGNVGIGTSSPSVKLHVAGSGYMPVIFEGGTNAGAGLYFSGGGTQFAEIFGEYESSNNGQMFFRTRNAGSINTAMTIKSSGNVGIGTSSPEVSLDVVGISGGTAQSRVRSTSGGDIRMSVDTVGRLGTYSNSDLLMLTNGSERMRVAASGNISIGTSNTSSYPYGERLNVNGNISSGGTKIGFGTTDSFVAYGWYSAAHYGISWAGVQPLALSGFFGLGFFTGGSEKMRVGLDGNVGIGTSSPSTKLEVRQEFSSGSQQFTPALNLRASQGGAWFSQVGLNFSWTDFGNGVAWDTSAIYGGAEAWDGTNSSGNLSFFTKNFNSGSVLTEKMRITSAGNVGIGTSSPSVRLDVVANTPNDGTRIRITNTSDTIYSSSSLELFSHDGSSVSAGTFLFSTSNNFTYGTISPNQTNLYGARSGGVRIVTGVAPIVFGNGANDIDFAIERMRITSSGNVGIGTTSPVRELQVGGFSGSPEICIGSGTSGNGTIAFGDGASGNDPWRGFVQYQHSTDRMVLGTANAGWLTLTSGGALGLNIVPTNTAGRFEASNDIVAFSSSDKNWKKNIKNIDSPLEKLSQINGVEFDWIEDEPVHGNKGRDIGVIAQEIEQVLPQIVQTRESGMKAVQYDKIIPLLIESIKEQQKQIEELKQIINAITK